MVSSAVVVSLIACIMANSIQESQTLPPQGFGGLAGPGFGPPGAGSNPWMPSWIANAPWMPKWTTCDYTTQPGASCQDCNTKMICTQFGGGIVRSCTDPTLPYCNLGQCSATPSAECAPVSAVPAA